MANGIKNNHSLISKANDNTSRAHSCSLVADVILSKEKISLKWPIHWDSVPVAKDIKSVLLFVELTTLIY